MSIDIDCASGVDTDNEHVAMVGAAFKVSALEDCFVRSQENDYIVSDTQVVGIDSVEVVFGLVVV